MKKTDEIQKSILEIKNDINTNSEKIVEVSNRIDSVSKELEDMKKDGSI